MKSVEDYKKDSLVLLGKNFSKLNLPNSHSLIEILKI